MDQSLKERLVGAAVLVVLAVIFVPMVLDGPDEPSATAPTTVAAVPAGASTFRYDLEAPLPTPGAAPGTTAPATSPGTAASVAGAAPIAVPTATAAVKPATAPATKPASSVAPKPAASEPKPTVTTKPTPAPAPSATGGWAAQVGSFSKQATADGVAADLKGKGFKAFVMPHKDGKTTLYRVRVGPVASREAADALAKKIIAKTGQTARPVPHP